MEKMRSVLIKIHALIEKNGPPSEDELKSAWNQLSDALTEHEETNPLKPKYCHQCGRSLNKKHKFWCKLYM